MAYDEDIATRIRAVLARQRHVSEQEMFGGLTFMLRGHMCCGVMDDKLVVRVGTDEARRALKKPHTSPFDVIGRPLNSTIVVASPGIDTDASLRRWVQLAVDFVSTLPTKEGSRK